MTLLPSPFAPALAARGLALDNRGASKLTGPGYRLTWLALLALAFAPVPAQADQFQWLPPTCAYRLVSEGKDLLLWHHLVCGDPEQVHKQRISQAGRMLSENSVAEDEWEDHMIFRAG